MNIYKFTIAFISLILIVASLTGVVSAVELSTPPQAGLENVRDFAGAPTYGGLNLVNSGGTALVGVTNDWQTLTLPADVVAGAVAIDPLSPQTIFVGAASETTLFRSTDGGATWLSIPLSQEYAGAVTDIAIDSPNHLAYVATDGGKVYQVRDVKSSMILVGESTFEEPVLEVATDHTGAGLVFARTQWNLFQAENGGATWRRIDTLLGIPTALAIANTQPATLFVGTTDMGLLRSEDGKAWFTANDGLNFAPGSRLQIDALAVDAARPDVLYVATSYLFGGTQVHQSPVGVFVSINNAGRWAKLQGISDIAVSDLLPVSGRPGSVYALLANSRTPFALGDAKPAVAPVADSQVLGWNVNFTGIVVLPWLVAFMAAMMLALAVLLGQYARNQQHGMVLQPVDMGR